MRTQKPLDGVGWLGGANNRRVVHEGAKAMSGDSAVDAGQTHSDEPTTKTERDDMLKRRGKHTGRLLYGPKTMMGRLIREVEAGERHLQSLKDDAGDMLCDLEDQVKRLTAEAAEHHLNLEDVCLQVNARNADVDRLEAERGCPSCAHCHLKRGGHLDAIPPTATE